MKDKTLKAMASYWQTSVRHLGVMTLLLGTTISQAGQISMETTSPHSPTTLAPQSMAPYWAKAGLEIQISTGQTLTKSLLKIGAGKLDSGIAPPLAYAAMQKGAGPYKSMGEKASKLAPNIRSLFALPGGYFMPISWDKDQIREISDARNKRVYIGPPAGAANMQIRSILQAGGLEQGAYEEVKAPWPTGVQGFQDGHYDLYVSGFSLGSQVLAELAMSRPIRILSLPPGMEPPEGLGLIAGNLPAGSFPGLVNEQDANVWLTIMMMAVNKDMDDETAYQMTRIFMENRQQVSKGNAVLADLARVDPFAGMNAPLHSGALRYYREAGYEVPARLIMN